MEEQPLNPLAVTHLLQHTLRGLCTHDDHSHWVYAVFWRILPRNYPPPKWDPQAGVYDRTRGNRRNWILAWEDGFCNFEAAAYNQEDTAACTDSEPGQQVKSRLQPELFFKMSHDIYNYGEGLIGKVAADHSHKWVFQDAQEHETNLVSWNNAVDPHPRTWEAQFESGIKCVLYVGTKGTIALIAVMEGVVQLGSTRKVAEDVSCVVTLRRKFSYLESIPGVLLPHPSTAAFPGGRAGVPVADAAWSSGPVPSMELYDPYGQAAPVAQMHVVPSMSSLEALLSKLPSVSPPAPGAATTATVAKEEEDLDHRHAASQCHIYGDAAAGSNTSNGGESTIDIATTTLTPVLNYYVNVAKPSDSEGF